MDRLMNLWNRVLEEIEQEVSTVSYDTWIKPIRPLGMTETAIRLSVPDEINMDMILTKFRSMLVSCIALAAGQAYELEVVCEAPRAKEGGASEAVRSQSPLNPKYSFENFVVGNNNNLAQAASLAVAEYPAV